MKKAPRPGSRSLAGPSDVGALGAYYARRLRSLVGVSNLELHLFAFSQGSKTLGLDGREVNKDVFTVRLLDEAVSFRVVEPFYGPFHAVTSDH